ncbi:MAG TPA: hypothetical protein VN032_02480 [Thermoanaerobaculia bacterium]|nr:hypothetical protein [Thermoanaerobaculia bacterium]
MSRKVERLLARLEAVRHRRPGAREAQRLLRAASGLEIRDVPSLVRLHEAVLFLRAYPHGPGVLRLAERILGSFEKRVGRLEALDEDLSAFDAPEVAGVAGTTIGSDFSFHLARWLARRHPGSVRLDWGAVEEGDRMRATWPEFLPLLEEEALADANVPYLAWLAAAAGGRRDDPDWLFRRYERLPFPETDRAERFDSLGLPISWDLGGGRASRTKMRLPGPTRFFHDTALLARRDVSFDAVFAAPTFDLRRLPRSEGERICGLLRETTAARYREFHQFTHADPSSVIGARPGRGVELFLVGVLPERRLPLRAAYGGFMVKNGVPVGYSEGLAVFERLEMGFNLYYTFREGESAWLFARMLKLHRDVLGVTSFSIDPYQIGFENSEAIASGAFWFYRKLGFRPTDPGVRRLLEREERRIAADPTHRSTAGTLRRLVTHNLLYEVPGSPRGEWDRFHVRNLGLAVNRRMAREFGGDARRLRASAERRVGRALRLDPGDLAPLERRAFSELALLFDLVPDLPRWSRDERDALAAIVRAKARDHERRYLRLLQGHPRLRRGLVRLGSRGQVSQIATLPDRS